MEEILKNKENFSRLSRAPEDDPDTAVEPLAPINNILFLEAKKASSSR